MRRLVTFAILSAVPALVCGCAPLVSTHKVRWVENEPLRTPIGISAVGRDTIQLADGRSVQMLPGAELPYFQEPPTALHLERTEQGDYQVFLKTRSVIRCGNPYIGILKLSLFTDELPKYSRTYAGRGQIEDSNR